MVKCHRRPTTEVDGVPRRAPRANDEGQRIFSSKRFRTRCLICWAPRKPPPPGLDFFRGPRRQQIGSSAGPATAPTRAPSSSFVGSSEHMSVVALPA